MSLTHAILGFLTWQPMTGYDLKNACFDHSVKHFWPADQAQIYRTLDKLAEQSMIRAELEVQTDRPNRKVYYLTESGRAELLRWLGLPQGLQDRREALLVQLFFADLLERAVVLEQLRIQKRLHQEQLAHYQHQVQPYLDSQRVPHDYAQMTLDFGIRFEQMYIDWLEACIKRIESAG
jgi:PadR family transcriptional regulator, regulatory protein AphA